MEYHNASNFAQHRARELNRVMYVVREDVGDYRVCNENELDGFYNGCQVMMYIEPNNGDGPGVRLYNADGTEFYS